MEKENKEIPFGAFDSELHKWEYTIPEGFEAEIKDGKVIIKKKESEDERIRKAIIRLLQNGGYMEPQDKEKAFAWLEKQKEQKPAEWSEEEEKDIQEASDYLRDYANNCVQGGNSKLYIQSLADRIESLRPQPHWKPSEEQINTLKVVARGYPSDDLNAIESLLNDLQKLL